MKICPECGISFEPVVSWQRFCKRQHRTDWHNREKLSGLPLTPTIRKQLDALAVVHDTTANVIACKMIDPQLNPGRPPISDEDVWATQKIAASGNGNGEGRAG